MPSPFPGMDPYLERPADWPQFHLLLITTLFEVLADLLPPAYAPRLEERSRLIDLISEEASLIIPDVAVDRDPSAEHSPAVSSGLALAEPVAIPLVVMDEATEGYIEIVHRADRELVTIIDVLSPVNKTGVGFDLFVRKRNTILRQTVHLVELDLLVGGRRIPTKVPLPSGDYLAAVARWERRPLADIYAWTVRQPLPPVPIPLRAPDPDVKLDLAAAFAETYRRGRYDRVLDYTADLVAPLRPADRDWAVALARQPR